jgi:hypothetical protein
MKRWSRRALMLELLLALPAAAQVASPHAIDHPRWFANSLLDLPDELADAARRGKRVMVYFGQDGCPYSSWRPTAGPCCARTATSRPSASRTSWTT